MTAQTITYQDVMYTKVDENHLPGIPYRMRIEANRALTEDEGLRLAGIVGYAWRSSIAGEPLYTSTMDTDRSVCFYADATKSRRDDLFDAWESFIVSLDAMVAEGSPVRKTNRAGDGTKGTRLLEGMGDGTQVSIWLDHVEVKRG